MLKKILKYISIALGCIILILIITNPSLKQFKEYIGERNEWKAYDLTFNKKRNWLIFSEYEFSYTRNNNNGWSSAKGDELRKLTGTYFAMFLNFSKEY